VLESKDFSLLNEQSEMRWKSTWLCSSRFQLSAQNFDKNFGRLRKHLRASVLESKDFSLLNEQSEMRWKSTWLCSSRFQLSAQRKQLKIAGYL
jgi:hypothetical protein